MKIQLIEGRVTEDRALPLVEDSRLRFMSRSELEEFVRSEFEEDNPDDEIATTQEILQLLGFLKEGEDLKQLLIDINSQGILGFFDPELGDLVIVGDVDNFAPLEELTYAHEYTHVLQHTRFDLHALRESVEDDSEASAGYRALVEGDATLSMLQYAFKYFSRGEIESIAEDEGDLGDEDTPQFLIDSISFPYQEGFEFVLSLFQDGGWENVDSAYDAPPVSTEQIMHPEKYHDNELPVQVTLPDLVAALGEGWEERDQDTLGEFDLNLLLKVHLSDSIASRAAGGWGGDRFVYLNGPQGERLLVLLLAWDSERDAEQFSDAYLRWLESQDLEPEETAAKLTWYDSERVSSLTTVGDRSLLILAPRDDISDLMLTIFPEFSSP